MEQGDAKNKKYLICRLGKQIMMAIKTSRLVHFINTTQTDNLYYTLTGERIFLKFMIHLPVKQFLTTGFMNACLGLIVTIQVKVKSHKSKGLGVTLFCC